MYFLWGYVLWKPKWTYIGGSRCILTLQAMYADSLEPNAKLAEAANSALAQPAGAEQETFKALAVSGFCFWMKVCYCTEMHQLSKRSEYDPLKHQGDCRT